MKLFIYEIGEDRLVGHWRPAISAEILQAAEEIRKLEGGKFGGTRLCQTCGCMTLANIAPPTPKLDDNSEKDEKRTINIF